MFSWRTKKDNSIFRMKKKDLICCYAELSKFAAGDILKLILEYFRENNNLINVGPNFLKYFKVSSDVVVLGLISLHLSLTKSIADPVSIFSDLVCYDHFFRSCML